MNNIKSTPTSLKDNIFSEFKNAAREEYQNFFANKEAFKPKTAENNALQDMLINIFQRGDLEELKSMVAAGLPLNFDIPKMKGSLIFLPVIYDNPEMLDYLISQNVNVNVGQITEDSVSPLFIACTKGSETAFECAKVLLSAGADINFNLYPSVWEHLLLSSAVHVVNTLDYLFQHSAGLTQKVLESFQRYQEPRHTLSFFTDREGGSSEMVTPGLLQVMLDHGRHQSTFEKKIDLLIQYANTEWILNHHITNTNNYMKEQITHYNNFQLDFEENLLLRFKNKLQTLQEKRQLETAIQMVDLNQTQNMDKGTQKLSEPSNHTFSVESKSFKI